MRLNSKSLAAIIVVVLFGGILLTNTTGWWATTTTKIPATFTDGDAAGQYNPADIRGSYTFGDITDSFGVPLAALQTAFEVPEGVDLAGFQVKSLETQYANQDVEIGTASLRLFVALYTNLPYDLSLGDYLPAAAAQVLREQAALTPERLAYLETHTAGAASQAVELVGASPTEAAAPQETPAVQEPAPRETPLADGEHSTDDAIVRGKTTFREVLDWGVTQARIETVIGAAMPDPLVVVRDFCTQNGLDFLTVKDALQQEVDLAVSGQ